MILWDNFFTVVEYCFLSNCQVKTLGGDVILYAVSKLTREYWAAVRGKWYLVFNTKNTSVHRPSAPFLPVRLWAESIKVKCNFFIFSPLKFTLLYTKDVRSLSLSLTVSQNSLVGFQTAYKMTSRLSVIAWQLDQKNQLPTSQLRHLSTSRYCIWNTLFCGFYSDDGFFFWTER